jgi:tyrosyl-tRNA synthetase
VIDVLDELKWRGLLAESTDEEALARHLAVGPVTFYVGFDPTAPSLHFGNLVQLMVARAMHRAGHKPLLLVGGSTGLIGDPKETAERTLNTKETVAGWVESIRRQVAKFLDFSGDNPARIVNNLDWTGPMPVLDFLRDIGKHFPINRMLARDVVRQRRDSSPACPTPSSPTSCFKRWITWSSITFTAAPSSSVVATSGATSPQEWS